MNVSVFKPNGRKNYVCQWKDPTTGKKKTKSTGEKVRRDADRFAGKLEAQLNDGTYHEDLRMTWDDFRERFEREYLPSKAKGTADYYKTVMNAVERIINPRLLLTVNTSSVSRLQAALRKEKKAEATIGAYMRHLKASLKWAEEQRYISKAPKIRIPRHQAMKGRAITLEEFERMLSKIPVLNTADEKSWEFFLRGLWLSGLRINEALQLHWTDRRSLLVDLSGEYPLIVIQAKAQKSRQYKEMPIVPEFAELLLSVPREERNGFVFNPISQRKAEPRRKNNYFSRLISLLGKSAGICVSESQEGKKKWASAHDFRRSFGFRWSRKVMPAVLQELMRHASIETTMTFYVGSNAQETARSLWSASANTLANTSKKKESSYLAKTQ